uniref:Ankyrin repeat family protein n=1 Tax=Rhizophora mucronata TaxID=61149 RepID=A0A2P2J8W1_RHIMU
MDDMGAIHFASQKGHLEVVRTLLSSGVSVKASTRKGLTALHYAAQASDMELVKYLVKKGASPTVKTKAGKTPRDLASIKEIRLFLKDCEQSHTEVTATGGEKADKLAPMPSMQDKLEAVKEETVTVEPYEERQNENVKRKGEEENNKEAWSGPKRARVALNHLLNADDTQEDENF